VCRVYIVVYILCTRTHTYIYTYICKQKHVLCARADMLMLGGVCDAAGKLCVRHASRRAASHSSTTTRNSCVAACNEKTHTHTIIYINYIRACAGAPPRPAPADEPFTASTYIYIILSMYIPTYYIYIYISMLYIMYIHSTYIDIAYTIHYHIPTPIHLPIPTRHVYLAQ